MPDETVWTLEHHTRAKHEILRKYLAAWFVILTQGGWNRRVVFLDGFAGPGVYAGGEPGSPIIALETLVNHRFFQRLSHTEFVMLFVENDQERHASLVEQIAAFWQRHGGQPENVKVEAVNMAFVDAAGEMLTTLEEQKKRLAPTFAFIDPFGFKGVPLDLICRLLAFDKCEVFFNFIYDSLNRWVKHPNAVIRGQLEELFGTDEYRQAHGMTPADRKAFLHDLYARQLETRGGFHYVHSFEMINQQGHTTYSLFFGTRRINGLRVMKDAMWSIDPVAGLRFSDRLAGQPVLFQPEPDFGPLRDAIVTRFADETVDVHAIEEFVLSETPYKASHYKKQVLKPLQEKGVVVPVSGQTKRGTYPDGTVLRFDVGT